MDEVATKKERLYATLCKDNGWKFLPLVFDTWGGIHGRGRQWWKLLSHVCTSHLEKAEQAETKASLRRGLAVVIAKAIASQLELVQLTIPVSAVAFPAARWSRGEVDEMGNDTFVEED